MGDRAKAWDASMMCVEILSRFKNNNESTPSSNEMSIHSKFTPLDADNAILEILTHMFHAPTQDIQARTISEAIRGWGFYFLPVGSCGPTPAVTLPGNSSVVPSFTPIKHIVVNSPEKCPASSVQLHAIPAAAGRSGVWRLLLLPLIPVTVNFTHLASIYLGDQGTPVCSNCSRAGRYCSRSPRSFESRLREYQPPTQTQTQSCVPSNLNQHQRSPASGLNFPIDPDKAVQNSKIASLFHHYITTLAPWYDLGDAAVTFGTTVSSLCLTEHLLFNAAIALAAIHKSKTQAGEGCEHIGSHFHERCVRLLIDLNPQDELVGNGIALASTCLLRSYEILDGDEDPNRHLQGAYSMASRRTLLFSHDSGPTRDLLAAGFWNYLREDITFSLFENCPLKIDLDPIPPMREHTTDQDYLNSVSLILGRIINAAFGSDGVSGRKTSQISQMLEEWLMARPTSLNPYSVHEGDAASGNPLQKMWFLQDCHAATVHYQLISVTILISIASSPDQLAKICSGKALLDPLKATAEAGRSTATREELLEQYASAVCGIAFTTPSPPVMVNAFGPISYCARFCRDAPTRDEIVRRLTASKKTTGWPVERMIKNLNESWAKTDESSHG
ncbi:uncharacterized protein MKZ38_010490 [Zalerion maritima]|uniref:Uncharacterized protein n=1 Tax=Zalerion maritima TaxID=339359 RepID=A0AAD5RTM9_9PEZI|nr:uncharacterized protein MKZ38_010490 [Zalerion maritima]